MNTIDFENISYEYNTYNRGKNTSRGNNKVTNMLLLEIISYSKVSSYPLLLSSTNSSEKCESPNANQSLGFSQSKYFSKGFKKQLIERLEIL